ncbi:hypothetical protein OOU_Y34scaffold01091g5 [Pyricularia oryzae Y34]|uniref:Uncharacterized protein n=1 Tax=Pyricularia oryzae (strain Y34) TaxID=1143189 RepID=A0AA97PFE4_PYRO3|nr:hypothetical protein OOU_Y34scaffold01091g5 [Pyricularia oryzae Y34]
MSDERSIPIGGHCPPNSTLKIMSYTMVKEKEILNEKVSYYLYENFIILNLATSAKSRSGEAAKPRSY